VRDDNEIMPIAFLVYGPIIAITAIVVGFLAGKLHVAEPFVFFGASLAGVGAVVLFTIRRLTDPRRLAKMVAEKILEERELEKLRAKEKSRTIATPAGGVTVSLRYNERRRKWVVAVPTGINHWKFLYFDDYDEAREFFEAVADELEKFFGRESGMSRGGVMSKPTPDEALICIGAIMVGLGFIGLFHGDALLGMGVMCAGYTTMVLAYTLKDVRRVSQQPEKSGQEIGHKLAEEALDVVKKVGEEKREESKFVPTPLGEWYVSLQCVPDKGWRVVVEKYPNASDYKYFYFKSYDKAKEFYDGLIRGIEEFFRGEGHEARR